MPTRQSSPSRLSHQAPAPGLSWRTRCAGFALPLLLAACGSMDDSTHQASAPSPITSGAVAPLGNQTQPLASTLSFMGRALPSTDAAGVDTAPEPGEQRLALNAYSVIPETEALLLPSQMDPQADEHSSESASGANAAGAPNDPLEPEKLLDLNNALAKTDLWNRIRKGFAMPDFDGSLVRNHERWYASKPEYVQRMTERASLYLFHIVEEVERRQMPSELALLPFIESAFNPRALSSAKASGMWQFIPATGRDYALKQNAFRDERRDVLASTRAALDYLQRLHGMFGDWHLALAAYNWGEGNVSRAIAHNRRKGLATDYASLRMPPETRNYVPKLQAVKNIVAQPEAFRLALPVIENHPYFVSVPIERDIDAALAANLADLSLDEFHALNPSLNRPVILAAGTPRLLLPYDNAESFLNNLRAHKGPLASWTAWRVPKTMRAADAAKRTGMTEAELREVNSIPPRMLVKAGSTLLVPRSLQRVDDVTIAVANNATLNLAPDMPAMRRGFVRAGKRETVASLAKRHRVNAVQFARWNRLSVHSRLKPGQRLAIYTVPSKPVARKASRTPVRVQRQQLVVKSSPRRAPAVVARSQPRRSAEVVTQYHSRTGTMALK